MMKYCILKKKSPFRNDKIDKELFDIYRTVLAKGYYKSQIIQRLPAELFRNILIHALRLRKYAWVLRFIKDFSQELDPERRENLIHYAMARYSFERGNLRNALRLIQLIKADNFIFRLDIRNLSLMIHFGLNNYATVRHLLSSHSQFLTTVSGLSTSAVISYKTFARALKNLVTIADTKKNSADYMMTKVLKEQFPYREWVERKYAALKGS
jgi:hypothetical protein